MDYSLLVGVDKARGELVVGVIDYCRQVGCCVGPLLLWGGLAVDRCCSGRLGWGMGAQRLVGSL